MPGSTLNVIFLSSWHPTRDNPTLGNFVQRHAEAVALYAKVTLLHVCFSDGIASNKEIVSEQQGNLTTHIIYIRKTKFKLTFLREISKLWKIIRAYQSAYNQFILDNKPDIVHANIIIPIGLIAYLFFKTKKIPYIISEHWTGYLPGDPNKPGRSMFFYRFFANKAACILPVTENLSSAIQTFGIRNNFSIIPNVVDTDLFNEKEKHHDGKIHLLHVSSLLDAQKNFSGILIALHKLKEIRTDFILEVISDGDFEQYKKKIDHFELKDYIIFHGKKNTVEVASIMKHCDLLVLFSNYENFPCVIPEAWSCGMPVISTDVGGIAEYMNDLNGRLIKVNDVGALVTELNEIISNIDKYDNIRIRNYAIDNFSYKVIGEKFINQYNKVIKP